MSFITKNANLLLLLLIVVSAIGLVGATVYFQSNFDKINANYQAKLSELNSVSKELQSQKALLDSVKSELTLKSAREEEFTGKYSEVRSVNLNLSQEKESLTLDNDRLQDTANAAQSARQKAESDLGLTQTQLRDTQAKLTSAQADATSYRNSYESCATQLRNARCNAFKADSGECACNLVK